LKYKQFSIYGAVGFVYKCCEQDKENWVELMRRQLKVIRKRHIAISVILAGICIIGLVYSDALQQKDRLRSHPAPAIVPGIAEISQSFSFANSTAKAPAPKVVIVSAENLMKPDIAAAEEAGGDLDIAQAGGPTQLYPSGILSPGRLEISRPSILYLRRTMPTFDKRSNYAVGPSRSVFAASAARYLDTPFNSLLDSVFKRTEDASFFSDSSQQKQDSRNPFTEARERVDSEASPSTPVAAAPPAAPPAKDPPPSGDQTAKNTPPASSQPPTGGGAPKPAAPEGSILVLGDFSGNGTLEARSASQIADGIFSFADGQLRTFSLFVNPAAVELQRSFAIDDFNRDGMPDLLVTSRAALLGAILTGDGNGNFALADAFATGYEPTVPVPGRLRETHREILSVNVRTGLVQTFRKTDGYRLARGQSAINFVPDFLARVTEMNSGEDCLLAAQSGKSALVYEMHEDSSLNESGDDMPSASSLSIDKDFLNENALGNLQVYQVGSSASILLTNSHRASFNVANFRLHSQIFLIVGDVTGRGTLDVAVGYLLSSTTTR
jgi:hypothetical protein